MNYIAIAGHIIQIVIHNNTTNVDTTLITPESILRFQWFGAIILVLVVLLLAVALKIMCKKSNMENR